MYDAEKEDIVEYKLQKERERVEQKLEKIEENGYNPLKANQTKSFEDILEKSKLEIDNDEELVDPSSCSEEIESMEERF